MPASSAAAATRLSGVAAPAQMRWAPSTSTLPKPFADSRTTTPSTPPSRTSRLEPTPTTVTGFPGSVPEERREIVLVRRQEQQLGRPADAEPGDRVERRRWASVRAAHCAQAGAKPGQKRLMRCGLCRSPRSSLGQGVGPVGDVAGAEQTTKSPGLGDSRHQRRSSAAARRCSGRRGGRRRGCRATSASRSTPSIGAFAGRIDGATITVSASLKQAQNSSNRSRQPRVAVRLHHGDDAALAVTARAALSTAAISTGWWP